MDGCRNESIVALCDVDRRQLDKAAKAYPVAKIFSDFRKRLEKDKGIDAVTVGRKIEWDSASLKAKNCPEADRFIRREYRKGWTL